MKKFLLSLSFLLASVVAFAAPRSLSQMKAAAKSVLKSVPAATRGGQVQLEVLKEGSQLTVLGYATGGFAVMANDDNFNAVLGYSDTKFSLSDMSPALQWWMEAAEAAMQQRLAAGATMMATTAPADLGYPTEIGGDDGLMVTKWDQSTPYNNRVFEEFGGPYPVGCVATAMAQIMYHHKYPVRGSGRTQFTFNGQTKFINFSTTTYRWDDMLPTYESGSYTDEQAEAVAVLMYHCGVAVDMSYGLGGSGAYDYNAALALEEHFGYSTKLYTRDIYTERDWMNIIYDEISNGRPIFYGGVTAQSEGHAFVFDGYNADGLVHVNWGWSGSGNGYYDVAILDSPTGAYSYSQDMVVMHPGGLPEIPHSSQFGILPFASYGNGSTSVGSFTVTISGNTLTYNATNVLNLSPYAFTGTLGLIAQPMGGGEEVLLDGGQVNSLPYSSGYPEFGKSIVSITTLPDGQYRVYLASKATQETEWQPVRSNETIVNNYILTKQGSRATVTAGEPGWTTGIENVVAGGNGGDGLVRVYTADGVLVYTAAADAFSIDDVPATGLLIVKNGAKTTKVVK